MLSLFSANAAFQAPAALGRAANVRMESSTDMEDLAKKLNPVVGFWDPLGMVTPTIEGASSWAGQLGDEGAIGFLRHAEIKHGRVAMAAFVGYCVQANGICFPWGLTGQISFADIAAAGSPPAQWDALPTASKWQIFLFIGLLEFWGEGAAKCETPHYTKGGKPGYFPPFDSLRETIGHPTLDLFDPFGLTKKLSPERKEKALLAEINNGRLAMLGIMSLVSAASVEGSVPALAGQLAHYDGEVMAPWAASDSSVPYVTEMLNLVPKMDSPSKVFWFLSK
mmetsp:Transcript_15247/g.41067  ORF Transcript_15247/g.41067 Transcript_15247/m.41067 type:complete len:280 (+) Transcript_15247:38-877(+)